MSQLIGINAVKDAEINLAAAITNLGFAGIQASKAVANTTGAASTSLGTGFYANIKLEGTATDQAQ